MGEKPDGTSTHLNVSGLSPTVVEIDGDAILIVNEAQRSKADSEMAIILPGKWTDVKEEHL